MKHILLAVLLSLGLSSTAQASINVNSWELQTRVGNPTTTVAQNTVALPFQATDTATLPSGFATSTTSYDFSVMGDSAWFQIDLNHQLASDQASVLLIATSRASSPISFTITGTESLAYSLDGFFTATGEADVISMFVRLVDFTNLVPDPSTNSGFMPTTVFSSDQDSRNATNESFVLGGTGGTNFNTLVGSPTGLLTPGVTYGLSYDFVVVDGVLSPVSAVGQLNLHISPVVPEASSIVIWGIGGIAALLGAARRRKRQPAAYC